MRRAINLRQIEAFKAVVEVGTVSQAAHLLHISQPAVSKLLAHLAQDTELELFDRVGGRLIPSAAGMRLYGQIDRIFSGIRQIEHAVDLVKREERGRITVGVLPAFSGMFISHATKRFIADHQDAHVSIIGRSSEFIIEWLLSNQLDIGIVNSSLEHPLIESRTLGSGELVCIAPRDHPLGEKKEIGPRDVANMPFIGFSTENRTRQKIETVLSENRVGVRMVVEANLATAVSEMVADGMGISILDPLLAYSQRDRLVIRPFRPTIKSDLRLCRLSGQYQRKSLIEHYIHSAISTADEMFASMLLPPRAL